MGRKAGIGSPRFVHCNVFIDVIAPVIHGALRDVILGLGLGLGRVCLVWVWMGLWDPPRLGSVRHAAWLYLVLGLFIGAELNDRKRFPFSKKPGYFCFHSKPSVADS